MKITIGAEKPGHRKHGKAAAVEGLTQQALTYTGVALTLYTRQALTYTEVALTLFSYTNKNKNKQTGSEQGRDLLVHSIARIQIQVFNSKQLCIFSFRSGRLVEQPLEGLSLTGLCVQWDLKVVLMCASSLSY